MEKKPENAVTPPSGEPSERDLAKELDDLHAKVIASEHRFLVILSNFLARKDKWDKGDPCRRAASLAFLFHFFSLRNAAIGTGGVIALLTLFMLWKQVVLLEEQNLNFRTQFDHTQDQIEEVEARSRLQQRFELVSVLWGDEASGKEREAAIELYLQTLKKANTAPGTTAPLRVSEINLSHASLPDDLPYHEFDNSNLRYVKWSPHTSNDVHLRGCDLSGSEIELSGEVCFERTVLATVEMANPFPGESWAGRNHRRIVELIYRIALHISQYQGGQSEYQGHIDELYAEFVLLLRQIPLDEKTHRSIKELHSEARLRIDYRDYLVLISALKESDMFLYGLPEHIERGLESKHVMPIAYRELLLYFLHVHRFRHDAEEVGSPQRGIRIDTRVSALPFFTWGISVKGSVVECEQATPHRKYSQLFSYRLSEDGVQIVVDNGVGP